VVEKEGEEMVMVVKVEKDEENTNLNKWQTNYIFGIRLDCNMKSILLVKFLMTYPIFSKQDICSQICNVWMAIQKQSDKA
jgi:hypothetical protein